MPTEKLNEIDLTYYAKYVKFLADNEKEELFLNSGDEHAQIVLSQIFKSSKEVVRIFAGNLLRFKDNDEYINALINFIERNNTELKILLNDFKAEQEEDFKNSKLFPILWNYIVEKNKNIKIKYTTKNFYSNEEKIHFTTGDNIRFRIETNLKERKARCCFNDRRVVENANELFDNEFNLAKTIDLTTLLYGNNK